MLLLCVAGGELAGVARIMVQLSLFPAINVVVATLPFWCALVERRRNIERPGMEVVREVLRTEFFEMLAAVMACLGRPCMTSLDEEEFVDHPEYRQMVMTVR